MESLLLYYRFAYDMIERVLLQVAVIPTFRIEWLSWYGVQQTFVVPRSANKI